ncbi:MAG: CBS domain-containing protein [Thaumarchaeota archaeon]|nr:CBS domain-containing protein [Candidatus Calditenuaceae archaeon]MDW8187136.1 CBS domain-containing protein [Nitrososphaerota archaeon]
MRLLVRDVMRRPVVTVRPEDAVWQALELMASKGIGAVVVADGLTPLGIITESDIVRTLTYKGVSLIDLLTMKASDIMSTPLNICSPEDPLERAVQIMVEKKVRRIPVVEKDKLVGIVTERDCLEALHRLLIRYEVNQG